MGGAFGRFFSSAGRIGPARVAPVTVAAAVICWVAGLELGWADTPGFAGGGALVGATLAKLAAGWGRRLHDTGRSGWLGAGMTAVLAMLLAGAGVSDLALDLPWLYPLLLTVAGLVAAFLLLRPGMVGTNRFGEPPSLLGYAPGPASGTARGAIWAIVSIAGGLLVGLALIGISHGLREETESRMRYLVTWGKENTGLSLSTPGDVPSRCYEGFAFPRQR